MSLITANDSIAIVSFGKAGTNFSCQDDTVHFWGNSVDAGLEIIFRNGPQKINNFSFNLKGRIRFNTEWGRVRFEAYKQSALEPCLVKESLLKYIELDEAIFQPITVCLDNKNLALERLQFIFIGPAQLDFEMRDIMVN